MIALVVSNRGVWIDCAAVLVLIVAILIGSRWSWPDEDWSPLRDALRGLRRIGRREQR